MSYKQYLSAQARDDFNQAKSRAVLSDILNSLSPDRRELLSLDKVRDLLRPSGESYKGMQVVDINKIIGSEGRYQDFNKTFLPRREYIRHRWENVDKAHLGDVILPPIKLYQIGGVYFVRDGNHRVSVARSRGQMQIDAEVIELNSEISIDPKMTHEELKEAVIKYEARSVFENSELGKVISPDQLQFTETGRYHEILKHIEVHKYYLNQNSSAEMRFVDAGKSWYNNLYQPIINYIQAGNVLKRFPGRTPADLYVWIIKHWGDLKHKYGDRVTLKEATLDYSDKYGKNLWDQILLLLHKIAARFWYSKAKKASANKNRKKRKV